MQDKTKVCRICLKEKPYVEFKKNYARCKPCFSALRKADIKHNEYMKLYQKRYSEKNSEKAIERSRKWIASHKDCPEYLAKKAKYRADNRESERLRAKSWYESNRKRCLAATKLYRENNRDKYNLYRRSVKARRRSADGFYTGEQISGLLDKQKGKCVYCKTSVVDKYEIDHIEPVAHGGSNWISNIQILCPQCNRKKSATDPIIFAQRNGFLI